MFATCTMSKRPRGTRPVAGRGFPQPLAGSKVPRPEAGYKNPQPEAGTRIPQPVDIGRFTPKGS